MAWKALAQNHHQYCHWCWVLQGALVYYPA